LSCAPQSQIRYLRVIMPHDARECVQAELVEVV
jgi:hypothetical protein